MPTLLRAGPESTPPMHTLTDRTARAAQWRFTGSAFASISQLVVGVLLARLLTPADFGVMALAWVVLGLARYLGDLGIGGAVVQRAALTERHVRTAFTFSGLLGVGAATILAAAAPLGAAALRNPQVTSVLRLLAIGVGVQGAAVVSAALLRRQLDFRRQSFIDIGSYLLGHGGVAVGLALLGYGVWSLAWGSLAQTVVASAAQLAVVRHAMRPLLGRRELADLLHFGLGSAAIAGVNYVALNADNFVIGRLSGAVSLGLYTRAYTLMNVPYTYASSIISSVLFPAFAQVQAEPARLRRAYLMLTQFTAMIAASAMGTMAIAAPHLVRSLYGPQWTGVVLPLQVPLSGRLLPGSLPPRRYRDTERGSRLQRAVASGRVCGPGDRRCVCGLALRPARGRGGSEPGDSVHVRRDQSARAARYPDSVAALSPRAARRTGDRCIHWCCRSVRTAPARSQQGFERRDHIGHPRRCGGALESRHVVEPGRPRLRAPAVTIARMV